MDLMKKWGIILKALVIVLVLLGVRTSDYYGRV